MALELIKQTAYGVDAQYWRANEISINRSAGRANWVLAGHITKAQSDAGGHAVDARAFSVNLAEVATGQHGALLAEVWEKMGELIYLLTKSQPQIGGDEVEFAGAKDV